MQRYSNLIEWQNKSITYFFYLQRDLFYQFTDFLFQWDHVEVPPEVLIIFEIGVREDGTGGQSVCTGKYDHLLGIHLASNHLKPDMKIPAAEQHFYPFHFEMKISTDMVYVCLLYTSDAADE